MNQEQKLAQAEAIRTQLRQTTDAVNSYLAIYKENQDSTELEAAGKVSDSHVLMIENVKQLQSAIYGPLNMVVLHYEEAGEPAIGSCRVVL